MTAKEIIHWKKTQPELHRKALTWLVNGMKSGKRYKMDGVQRAVLLDIFTSPINLPTTPTEGYPHYFAYSENFTHIRMNQIKNKLSVL